MNNKTKLSFNKLMWTYISVPFLLFIASAFYFMKMEPNFFHAQPDYLPWYSAFLVFPHIISGIISLSDKEYLVAYKSKIIQSLIFAILIFLVISSYDIKLYYLVFTLGSGYHLFMQQRGIAFLFGHERFGVFKIWGFINLLAVVYCVASAAYSAPPWIQKFQNFAFSLMIISVFMFLYLLPKVKSNQAKFYLIANQALFISFFLFYYMDFLFLMVAVPRFIHDTSAFYFNYVHDMNRNAVEKKNFFYKNLRINPLYFPILALVIANAIYQIKIPFFVNTVFILATFHFFIESVIWKRGTPHRKHVDFSP